MEENKTTANTNREMKSSAFTALFSDPKNAALLYAALDGEKVSPEDIQFTTLEGVLFMAKKNDLAFTAANKVLIISEHQSTLNENMPLRMAIYYGRTMEQLIEKRSLYRTRMLPIPTPEFYMFYNGDAPFPSEKILKLSDAYLEKEREPMLNLQVKAVNINLPENHALLQKCRPLYEYSWLVQRMKEYQDKGEDQDSAIINAVKDCEREGILTDFVKRHGSEVVNMLFTQFNMEDALEVRWEEGLEEGLKKGEIIGIIKKVLKKLQKGKTAEMIAEDLEEEPTLIEEICAAIKACGPDPDMDAVYTALEKAGQTNS